MARRLPGLSAMRTFEAAARHLSFTRAGQELGVTASAVSAQMQALEQQLAVRLFWRTSRTMRLTRAGETLAAAAAQAFRTLEQAVEQISGRGERRAFTISVGMSFAFKWLAPRLDRFRRLHPDIDVRLDVTERVADFAREQVDAAIRFGTGAYPGLRCDRLFEEHLFPVCSPRLLQGLNPLRVPDDLRHHTLIHGDWQAEDGSWPDWPMWLLAAGVKGVDPSRGIHFQQTALVLQAALDGQGVALGNTSLAADDLAAGRLVRPFGLSLKGPSLFAYHLVTPLATAERPVVKAFREWILAEARASDPSPSPRGLDEPSGEAQRTDRHS